MTLTTTVLPLTDATVPRTALARACCGAVHVPSGAVPITTLRAVTCAPPDPSSCVGRTATQLPAVTSVTCAGVSSATVVDGVTSTVAVPFR